jgi:hypothetical protein
MRNYAKAWPDRVWAVEGANGVGRALAQRLLEADTREFTPWSVDEAVTFLAGTQRHSLHAAFLVVIAAACDEEGSSV